MLFCNYLVLCLKIMCRLEGDRLEDRGGGGTLCQYSCNGLAEVAQSSYGLYEGWAVNTYFGWWVVS
jgi:hypothetical protein